MNPDGLVGVEITSRAFQSVIPFFPFVLAIAIVLFAFSTIISWSYYGQKSWTYIFGEGKKRVLLYQLIFCMFIVVGSSMNIMSIIDITDAMMFAMSVPNMIGLYLLTPLVLHELKIYCRRHNVGIHKLPDGHPDKPAETVATAD